MSIKKFPFPVGAFFACHITYSELLLYFWSTESFNFMRLLIIVTFSMGLGLITSTFINLLKKHSKIVAMILAGIVTVLMLMQYFILDAYKNFMPMITILNGAGGVAKDFLGLTLSLLFHNLWRIAVAFLPMILYGLFGKEYPSRKKEILVSGIGSIVSYALAFSMIIGITNDITKLTDKYNFDISVRYFGLNVAMVADIFHSGSGKANSGFETVSTPEPVVVTIQEEITPSEETIAVDITIPEETEPPKEYEPNVIDGLDFKELAEQSKNTYLRDMHEYVGSLTPTKQNEFTGMFKGKNLIFITAEAFTKELIDPIRTPTLYRLSTQGIEFSDYYQPAWGASTTSGEFSNLTSIVPTNGGDCMSTPVHQDMFLLIGKQLQAQNYYSAAYHNHHANFYNRNKTHTFLGYDKFLGIYGGLENVDIVWPESDKQMMDATIDDYINNQPFSIYYMTVSGHSVYAQNQNVQAKKNYSVVENLNFSEPIKCYIAANMELEYAMETLVNRLEEAGIADDTVIVMATDHYPYGLEKSSTWDNNKNYLKEWFGTDDYSKFTRDHNQLIIWSGCLEGQNIKIDEPVYSLDILPTLLNLFGCEYDSRLLVGRDIFSDAEPLVLWMDYSWKTNYASYNATNNEITVKNGIELPEGYVEYIDSIVKNKIRYSRFVIENNYFNNLPNPLK